MIKRFNLWLWKLGVLYLYDEVYNGKPAPSWAKLLSGYSWAALHPESARVLVEYKD